MADGQLRRGTDFLKIGSNYLRIGPAPSVGPQIIWVQDANDASVSTLTFSISNPGVVDHVIILSVHSSVVGGQDAPALSGDLTWTEIDEVGDPTLTSEYYSWWWAVLPAGDPDPSVTLTFSTARNVFVGVYAARNVDLTTPIVQDWFTSEDIMAFPATVTLEFNPFASASNLAFGIVAASDHGQLPTAPTVVTNAAEDYTLISPHGDFDIGFWLDHEPGGSPPVASWHMTSDDVGNRPGFIAMELKAV